MRSILLSLFYLGVFVAAGSGQTIVTGRVTGIDDRQMVKANVFLRQPFDTTTINAADVGRSGEFKISIPSKGIWLLVVTGVHHADHTVALYVEKRTPIEVNVRLGAYTYLNIFDDVKAFGSFNNWYNLTAIPLHKQPDGTYTANVKTKSPFISYKLMNVRYGGSIEGTQPADYTYDIALGYESKIKAKNGIATIVFDPQMLPRSERGADVSFPNAQLLNRDFNEIYEERTEFQDAFRNAFREYMASRGRNPQAFRFDFSDAISTIKKRLEIEKDPVLRRELFLNYLTVYVMDRRADPTFYSTVLREIPPSSVVWSLDPHSIFFAVIHSDLTEAQKDEYVHKVIEGNSVKRIASALLFDEFMAAKMMVDAKRSAYYYEILARKFGDTPEGRHVERFFSNPSALDTGRPVPSFSVASSDNMARLITNKSLLGKNYLLFFWAARDSASVEEVRYLQKAYEKYKSSKFEILSLSVDSSYTSVVDFRKGRWKMPWLNAFSRKRCEQQSGTRIPGKCDTQTLSR